MTTSEAARALGIARSTLYMVMARGELAVLRIPAGGS